jgi:Galactokinase
MYDIERDFEAFEEARRREAAGFFSDDGAPVFAARAPGRLDVMGGISDYSGGLVAEMPIAAAAVCAAQRDDASGGEVVVRSANAALEGLITEVRLPAEVFVNPVSLLKFLLDGPDPARWAGYVAGCVGILRSEGLIPRGVGARFFVRSDVPLGAGVSSSAAVEVASMRALCAAFGVELSGIALARLCQRVEHEVMDAPCGIMDQVTSAMGEAGKLLLLLCQPHDVQGTVALPDGWSVFGLDSGVKHSVGGSAYIRTRVAAFMGYKILAEAAGTGFGGYLCNLTPERYRELSPEGLPETISGSDFMAQYGGIFDTVTTVDRAEMYPVRAAAEYAIYERRRVSDFVDALRDGGDAAMAGAGRCMAEAHAAYSACGMGSAETDLLAKLASAHPEVAGAKITGGGSGGTVCVLCRAEAEERLAEAISAAYHAETGIVPRRIRGTSPGALATPVRQLTG